MWVFFQSFFGLSMTYLLRVVVIKFVLFTAILALLLVCIPYVAEKINAYAMENFGDNVWFDVLPTGAAWFMSLLRFDIGLPMLFSAMFVKFCIRRIPGFG